jgi:class 3 adenylate cyclase/tetratricopeptide (TPR) repeat protein
MRCAKCGTDNREGRKFCAKCGDALVWSCPKCGATNEPGEDFCGDCGGALSTNGVDIHSPQAQSNTLGTNVATSGIDESAPPKGERRHLTVLFCDLVDSTEIAARLDPEEWRDVIARYQQVAAQAVVRFGGQVAQYLGDGVLALFGYPTAHENAAERAVRTGLEIIEGIGELNAGRSAKRLPALAARVGIHAGPVVVGDSDNKSANVFGDPPNVAARIQAAAEPNTVVVSNAVHLLVSGRFVVEKRSAHTFKGVERPIQLYRVIRASGMRGRFETLAASGALTPFVGRDDELRSLISRWERVREGEGQVVTIIGEAGIGKSRLVRRFREQIATSQHTWLEAGGGLFFQNTPFYPISEMLRQVLTGETAENLIGQLTSRLNAAGLEPPKALPLIAPLLNLTVPPEYSLSTPSPELQRRRLLATLVEWVMGSARTQPLVSVIEDLHWIDPSTLELIQLLVEQGAAAPLLLVCTARPEFRPPWPTRAHHTQLMLNRLNARNARAIIGQVIGREALSEKTIDAVVERAGGVPLFVEELTRAILESGAKGGTAKIPATLQDSLMARLDRLGSAKEVIQIGAVIGGDFPYALLRVVHPIAEPDLLEALRVLADEELLYVRGIAPEASYQFKHALIRDAAYEALLKRRRRELHFTVAHNIDEKFPVIKETQPEVLARHWMEAGEHERAIASWQKAGERAEARSALIEAEQHYREALAMLMALPESSERNARELDLQLALGRVMVTTRGWAAVETTAVYARVRTIAELTDTGESLQVLTAMWVGELTRGELRPALVLADQMLEKVRGIGSARVLATAHYTKGNTHFFLGDLAAAHQYYLQAIEHFQKVQPSALPGALPDELYGGCDALVWAGLNEWLLGYPDQALRYTDDARALARRLNNPFASVFALGIGVWTKGLCGDFAGAYAACQEVERLGTESSFPVFSGGAKIGGGWARAHLGETGGVLDSIRAGLAEVEATKLNVTREQLLCVVAETQALAGAIDDAIATVEQALAGNPAELWHRPLTLHLRGQLRFRRDADGATRFHFAERDFREAIELARKMNAKSPELRATTSLARLLEKQSRRDEARAMMAEIYGWFTEGFDTADLKDAKALLAELSR